MEIMQYKCCKQQVFHISCVELQFCFFSYTHQDLDDGNWMKEEMKDK
jgi:hypothetical protein